MAELATAALDAIMVEQVRDLAAIRVWLSIASWHMRMSTAGRRGTTANYILMQAAAGAIFTSSQLTLVDGI